MAAIPPAPKSPRFVRIRAVDVKKPLVVVATLTGPPETTGGIGGWEEVPRPGRRPLTAFRGVQEGLRLVLPILLDRYHLGPEGHSVEGDIRDLEKMGGLDRGDPRPPLLVVEGAGVPHDYTEASGNRWVLESLEGGDVESIRRSDGDRVRYSARAHLLEYTADDRIDRPVPRRGKPRWRFVTAHSGDTFARIARRELGHSRLGGRLARANKGRSADVKLPKGKRVRVPAGDELKDWIRDLGRR